MTEFYKPRTEVLGASIDQLMEDFVPVKERNWYPWVWMEKDERDRMKRDDAESYQKYLMRIRELGRKDLFFFNDEIMREPTRPRLQHGLHDEVCHLLQKESDILFLLPRGHLKTTIGNIGYVIWKLGNNPDLRILDASDTLKVAKKFSSGIRQHILSNKRLKFVFPKLVPKLSTASTREFECWNDSEMTVERNVLSKEPSLTVMGSGQTLTGLHFDLQIYDDIVTMDNANTKELMQGCIDWFDMSLSLLDPMIQGRLVLYGTRYDFSDLYGHVEEKYPHLVVYRRSWIEDGKPIWNEPKITLNVKRVISRMSPYMSSCQYYNNPIVKGDEEFKPEFIKRWNMKTVFEAMKVPDDKTGAIDTDALFKSWVKTLNVYMGLDPNRAQKVSKQGDYCAVVVVGVDAGGNKYVLDYYRDKPTSSLQIVKEFCDMFEKWNPLKAGLEVFGGDAHLYKPILAELKNRQIPSSRVRTFDTNTRISTPDRIRGMQMDFETGMVYVREDGMDELVQELLHFPHAKHDDLISTLAYILIQLCRKPKIKEIKQEQYGWRTHNVPQQIHQHWMLA